VNEDISSNFQFSAFVNALAIIVSLGSLCYSPDGILVIKYILLVDQARGPYWENIGPRSWQYGPIASAARSVQKKTERRYSPSTVPSKLDKVTRLKVTRLKVTRLKVIRLKVTRLKKAKTAKTQVRNHSGQCPVQYLEYIGPATEYFDWLILVIGLLTAWVV